ncbi:MAG: tetratricopeptide repeat protein [Clostridia bacterium]|nr:tetratricopeptide repeat protein [Clostridia bacterium]
MIIEQLIFTVISFTIFVYMFFRMIRNNDTTYVAILLLEAVGIALNFLEVLFTIKLNTVFIILKYILAIILPIGIIILEKRNITLFELVHIQKAKLYLKLGDNKKAKQALIDLLEKKANSYKGHKMLAEIYELEGGMRKAIDEYVQAIDLNKKDYDSYYKVAELLNNLDKKDEASEMLFNLLNKKPEMYKASELLGEILIEKERYKEAVNIYQDALKYNPISYELNYNLGIAYTMLNDFQNAKICYEKAAQINSLLYNAKYSLAEIALIYKDLEEAERRFLEAIEDEELSADGYYELAKIYLIKGDKDTAIKYINTAIDTNAKSIVEKVKKEPIFIPIMAKISIPFNLEEPERNEKSKLQEKEIKAKEHLEEMSEITRHLSYNDIKMLRKNSGGRQKKVEERNWQEQILGREIQE